MNPSIQVDQIPFFLYCSKNKVRGEKKQETMKPSLYLYDESCKNLLFLSQKIQKIENYQEYFRIPEKIKKIEKDEKGQNHVWLYYPVNTLLPDIPFSTFLLQNKNPKQLLFYLQDSYQHLLKSIQLLQKHHLCYFALSSQTILFESTKPLLIHFDSTIQTNDRNLSNKIMQTIQSLDNFSHQPLEVHVLYFLWKNELSTLSYTQIEEISSHYVKTMPIFSLFSDSDREKYKDRCIETLKLYVNQPQKEIVEKLIPFSPTWDNFALSVLYLYVVEKVIRSYSLKNTFFNGWFSLLIKELDPEPSKRVSIKQTMEQFEHLYEEYPDWSFVKSLT